MSEGSARPALRLTEVVIDAADAHALGAFYQRLLGGELVADEPDWVLLREASTGLTLAFGTEPDYEPPTWPDRRGRHGMMLHLDFLVDDLDEGVAHAERSGARLAAHQPQELVRVLLDPDGHPFCLWVEPPEASAPDG
jgi:catechol 2,3-dioxygenase-like lactoylglutathione lyase family enzyme